MAYKHFDSGDARFKALLAEYQPTGDGVADLLANITMLTYTSGNIEFTVHMNRMQMRLLHQMLTKVVAGIGRQDIALGYDVPLATSDDGDE